MGPAFGRLSGFAGQGARVLGRLAIASRLRVRIPPYAFGMGVAYWAAQTSDGTR